MDEAQGAGEVMALALIDHADQLGKSARMTQQTLEKQIEELVAIEARVKVAVQSIHAAVKSLEGERVKMEAERVKLKAVGPELQQGAVWAMRETLREQAAQIKHEMRAEVKEALVEPLQSIQHGARHVRENVKETKWLTIVSYVLLGCVLGLMGGYVPVRRSIVNLEEHVTAIDQYLGAQQQAAAAAAASPTSPQDHKKKGK